MPTLTAEGLRRILRTSYRTWPDAEALIELAVSAWARAAEARALIQAEGFVVELAGQGKVAHPALRAEKDATTAYLAALRALRIMPRSDRVGRPTRLDRHLFVARPDPSRLERKYFGPG